MLLCRTSQGHCPGLRFRGRGQLNGITVPCAVNYGANTDLKAASKGEARTEPKKPKPDVSIFAAH